MSDLRGGTVCVLLGLVILFALLFAVVSEAEGQEKLHVDGVIDSQSSICDGGCMNKESTSKLSICSGACMTVVGEQPSGLVAFAGLPDNPAPQKSICYRGTIDAAGQTVYREIDCGLVPSWRDLRTEAYKKPGFWTVGRWDAPAPLRTNRELWRSKSFWLEELGLYGSTYAEVAISRSGRQNPPVPRGWDLDFDAFAPLPVITAMHVLARKYICQCIGDGAVLGATAWNLYSAGKQYYH